MWSPNRASDVSSEGASPLPRTTLEVAMAETLINRALNNAQDALSTIKQQIVMLNTQIVLFDIGEQAQDQDNCLVLSNMTRHLCNRLIGSYTPLYPITPQGWSPTSNEDYKGFLASGTAITDAITQVLDMIEHRQIEVTLSQVEALVSSLRSTQGLILSIRHNLNRTIRYGHPLQGVDYGA